MPAETTRQLPHLQLLEGGLDFEIREHDEVVRVALSGTLDHDQLSRLKARLTARLPRRGRRIVLDGGALDHLDYRAVDALIAWARDLRTFGHRLSIVNWSPYLRAILALGGRPAGHAAPVAGPLAARRGASRP